MGVALAVVVEADGRPMAELDELVEAPTGATSGSATSTSPFIETTRPSRMESASAATPCVRATSAMICARTASHASLTAPPDIQVWRLALVEPAEPMRVSARSSTMSSAPSGRSNTVRANCWAIVTKPCPTSAHAHFTEITPSTTVHEAVE